MSYSTLMVHLDLGRDNTGLLKVTADLAKQFHAVVVGIVAGQPRQTIFTDGCVPDHLVGQTRLGLESQIKAAEGDFRGILSPYTDRLEWRSMSEYGLHPKYLSQEARCADLIITCVDQIGEIGDLVMHAGRPVLIVPQTADKLALNHILIGWKETREARRAISDALPLLLAAKKVTVVELGGESDMLAERKRLSDVVAWLARHGVVATPLSLATDGNDAGGLDTVAKDLRADVIVAGAYGHNRLHEWIFGGITRDLLLQPDQCTLVSH
jgi:nucleotide-binding universal stress UspA family protein